ncbi:hypothetical protein AHF37_09697 [Paragonimus kellicotti]|nr:hypothetical protein AHF37_09697 [Paragonimus kellicotti]
MQLPTISCLVFLLACAFAVNTTRVPDNARDLYEQFKRDYGKVYANDDDEKRFAIFKENLLRAQSYQLQERGTAKYGVTQFFDLTPEEFAAKFLSPPIDDQVEHVQLNDLKAAPERIDWREKGAVAPVEDQGSCGSCWAFSVAGNIEGQWFLKTGQLVSLSKQQLVDCDVLDSGCDGGLPQITYGEIIREQTCRLDKSKLLAKIDGSIVLEKDEYKQAAWLAEHGPWLRLLMPIISRTVYDVGSCSFIFQYYQSGISHPSRYECDPAGLNHAVLTVGYGTENGIPYWIIKNSWNVNWGEKGYFRLYRGKGICGINRMSTSAIIN